MTSRMALTPSISAKYVSCVLLAIISSLYRPALVQASALTTTIPAGERHCFHVWVDKPKEKVGFYFAVQSGGSFDIDWTVTDPRDKIVIEGEKERQGDFVFTANEIGEYSFCLNNDMSSFSDKIIDFDITVENEPRSSPPLKQTSVMEQSSSLEDSIYKLSGSLSNIQRTQKYFRTRENRNSATVKDTQNRIFYFNIGISLLLIGISFTQVWIVRKFFNSPGKQKWHTHQTYCNVYPSPLRRRAKEPCNNFANNKHPCEKGNNDVMQIVHDQRSQSSSTLTNAKVNKLESRIQPQSSGMFTKIAQSYLN
ncbi:hypothetical protein PCANC_00602 [Puccinia coronata f. sp. avenae]|uniref:GOLD domain-containing protein n=1 Tax=Puccinia coronata f. sp. avenae TaxID=200324 RepID=A0A2N5W861_9BASI|nr:hypothetical protein PCANC_00602 [Puccinia coronata f. sp. avenae]